MAGGLSRSHRLVLFLVVAVACALLTTKWPARSEPTDPARVQVSGKIREAQDEVDRRPKTGGGRAAIIGKWATSFDPTKAGIDPELAKRLKDLVEAGSFKEAAQFFMSWEDEQWQQAAAHYVWFHWGRQNRDEARDFLGSMEMLPNALMSASSGLFDGLANRTAPEDIEWMKDFLTKNHKPTSVPGVEGNVAKLWVATGVISAGEFMEWAHVSGDEYRGTWIWGLSLAPKTAFSYAFEGQLSKGDLMALVSSCLEVARELQPAIEGADERSINPKAERPACCSIRENLWRVC